MFKNQFSNISRYIKNLTQSFTENIKLSEEELEKDYYYLI